MKLEEVNTMDAEQLGDKVAKLCEWTHDKNVRKMFFVSSEGDILGFDWPSLDAMHEALNSFNGRMDLQMKFMENLDLIIEQTLGEPGQQRYAFAEINATTIERAKAFVLTMEEP